MGFLICANRLAFTNPLLGCCQWFQRPQGSLWMNITMVYHGSQLALGSKLWMQSIPQLLRSLQGLPLLSVFNQHLLGALLMGHVSLVLEDQTENTTGLEDSTSSQGESIFHSDFCSTNFRASWASAWVSDWKVLKTFGIATATCKRSPRETLETLKLWQTLESLGEWKNALSWKESCNELFHYHFLGCDISIVVQKHLKGSVQKSFQI